MIPVTKPFLPPIEEYNEYLKGIWERNRITNSGPLVTELEDKLKKHLGVKHLFFVANGTIALQIAIKALELEQEVITTPFSYVATTASIVWEGCTPVFADINKGTLCIDPENIKSALTDKTSGILATHVYGSTCDVEGIKAIANDNNLKLIYDGAHAFGVNYKDTSVLNFGDISTLSFHAIKIFHTGEGGAVITNNDELAHKIWFLRNAGHKGEEDFWGLGINGKNSELHAAMGLSVLPHIKEILARRKKLTLIYDEELSGLFKSKLKRPALQYGSTYNYSYYPIILSDEETLLTVKSKLEAENIFPRRYFYPALSTLNYVKKSSMPVAEDIAKRVICLPLYHTLTENDVSRICSIIKTNI